MENMIIRQEEPADFRCVENVIRDAFWNVYAPGCDDHYLIHRMRDTDAFVPELSLVAVLDGQIVGTVVNMRSHIEGDDGNRHEVLSLGPIGVLPGLQGKHIGSMLVRAVQQKARAMGFRAILLCGDHTFYGSNGFVRAEEWNIRTAENEFLDALHVCGLSDGAPSGLSGRYFEPDVYNIDPTEAERFDRSFPSREKLTDTPSQRRFLESLTKRRPAE